MLKYLGVKCHDVYNLIHLVETDRKRGKEQIKKNVN